MISIFNSMTDFKSVVAEKYEKVKKRKIYSVRVILFFDRGYVRLSYKNNKCKITAVVDLFEEKE